MKNLQEQTFLYCKPKDKGELDKHIRNNYDSYFRFYSANILGDLIELNGYNQESFYKKVGGRLDDIFFWKEENKFIIPANEGVFEIREKFYQIINDDTQTI